MEATQEKFCARCGAAVPRRRGRPKYCSTQCAIEARSPWSTGKLGQGLPTATVGALSELVACADLLRKGWSVFRAVSPACSCDLIAMRLTTVLRIEVRTAYRLPSGELTYSKATHGPIDCFAAVVKSGEVEYFPPLP